MMMILRDHEACAGDAVSLSGGQLNVICGSVKRRDEFLGGFYPRRSQGEFQRSRFPSESYAKLKDLIFAVGPMSCLRARRRLLGRLQEPVQVACSEPAPVPSFFLRQLESLHALRTPRQALGRFPGLEC